ncbi:retinitis pigmentosa 1-like 1 protein [Dendronephthya gigantea]|uniref:retinitis pigmentosa 1-like 1 protein n=1 Tax=Dendronephthya gigantea TaxID=151771 RepID=UPI00106D929A|nr:retinitis pigmentosa 1-like 1 protein [Dendronephthya gigantea]
MAINTFPNKDSIEFASLSSVLQKRTLLISHHFRSASLLAPRSCELRVYFITVFVISFETWKLSQINRKSSRFASDERARGKKEADIQQPVDHDTEATAVHNCEETPEKAGDIVEQDVQAKTSEDRNVAEQSSGEDGSPKSNVEPGNEGKKKSKRRSLFKRSSKRNSANEDCELKTKESDEGQNEAGLVETTAVDIAIANVDERQVVCEEKHGEVTDQSDGEGYFSVGEASEVEGEALAEEKTSPESEAEIATDKGTKRKSFFKRGLSLKRRKAKKQTHESKEETVTTEKSCCEAQAQTESSSRGVEVVETTVQATTGVEGDVCSQDINNESETDAENTSENLPVKSPRKVSFVGPDGKKIESSDEGDSLAEQVVESADESDEDTVVPDDGPSKVSEEASGNTAPEIVVVSEEVACVETPAEGDDDDLTEVSSMCSDLLASSDAPDTISTSDTSRLFVFTDTEDSGSRITLEEISEESEAEPKEKSTKEAESESKPAVVGEETEIESKPEVVVEETGLESKSEVSKQESSEQKDENEATKLLGNDNASKACEWEMVDKSYDMSVELSRVRKQTLFSVKRLCCSVM